MENNFDCLLLASGGMDSTVLAYKLAKENKNVVILKNFLKRTQEELPFEKAMEIIKESR